MFSQDLREIKGQSGSEGDQGFSQGLTEINGSVRI